MNKELLKSEIKSIKFGKKMICRSIDIDFVANIIEREGDYVLISHDVYGRPCHFINHFQTGTEVGELWDNDVKYDIEKDVWREYLPLLSEPSGFPIVNSESFYKTIVDFCDDIPIKPSDTRLIEQMFYNLPF